MQRLSACECDAQLAMKPHTYAHTWISSTNTTAHTHTLSLRGWTDLVFALLVSQANVLQTCARKVCNRKCCPPAQTKGLLLKFLCCSVSLSLSRSLSRSLSSSLSGQTNLSDRVVFMRLFVVFLATSQAYVNVLAAAASSFARLLLSFVQRIL